MKRETHWNSRPQQARGCAKLEDFPSILCARCARFAERDQEASRFGHFSSDRISLGKVISCSKLPPGFCASDASGGEVGKSGSGTGERQNDRAVEQQRR